MNNDIWNKPNLISRGLLNIGKNKFIEYINDLPKNVPLIEIGSGNGAIAKELNDIGFNIITVDPLIFNAYSPPIDSIVIQPKYETLNQLISCNDHIIDNCNLLLNWCSPNCYPYDIESIRILKPHKIIVITELNGCSNSYQFHKWIRHIYPFISCDTKFSFLKHQKIINIDDDYNIVKIDRYKYNLNTIEIQIAIMEINKDVKNLIYDNVYQLEQFI